MKKIKTNIPPVTSTGRKVRNPNARLAGLANMSIGRYMSEMKKEQDDESPSFDINKFSKSEFNKKTQVKKLQNINIEPISCKIDVIKEDVLIVTLEFNNVELDREDIKFIDEKLGYFIPVTYAGKISYLSIITVGNIIEFEITYINNSKSFRDEIYVPELLKKYNSSTMKVTIENNYVKIIYEQY